MKICLNCSKEKDKTLFRSGRNQCLECYSFYLKNYRKQNKYVLKRKRDEKNINEPEKQKIANKKSYENHKKDRLARNKKYYDLNKETLISYQRDYRAANNELIATYHRNKYHNNLHYKLKALIRSAIRRLLKTQNANKGGLSASKYLLYTINDLKNHIESLFEPWMNWNNQGKYNYKTWKDDDQSTWTWQIDHIVPQSKLPYTSMEDENFKKCWALENLRPYPAKQNLLDGNKRI